MPTMLQLLAQEPTDSPETSASPNAAASLAACGIGGLGCLIALLIWLGLYLWIALWVTKDAKRRNSPNATLVTVLAWIPITTGIGWIVHLITRPKNGTGSGSITPPPVG